MATPLLAASGIKDANDNYRDMYLLEYSSSTPLGRIEFSEVRRSYWLVDLKLDTDGLPPTIDIKPGGATSDVTPVFKGTAGAGLIVKLFDNGGLLGSTVADGNGKWTYTVPDSAPLARDISHNIEVKTFDNAGHSSAKSSVYSFTVYSV